MPNSCIHSADMEEKRVEPLIYRQDQIQRDQALTKAKELEIAKAKMGEVREENERLQSALQHIKKDYQSLQLRYFDIVKQDEESHFRNPNTEQQQQQQNENGQDRDEEADLVSLCLGRGSPRDDHEAKNSTAIEDNHHQDLKANELTLGSRSETRFSTEVIANDESAENCSEDQVKESAEVPRKSVRNDGDHDEASHEQSQAAKRARVSVRARCETPTMNDGCQWRKYGQKIAKGNPCPRAYYRCTVAPSCPVRKQVQRCADDMSILITTYEGTHNHPLPVTATAMASTTSAAASMLLSGSSTSPDQTTSRFPPMSKNAPFNTSSFGLNNYGHYLDISSVRPKQFHFPSNSSSLSPLFPTITLDLTSSPIPRSSSSSSSLQPLSSHFMNRSSSLPSNLARIPSSSLSFSYSSDQTSNNVNFPTLWANGSSYLGYNANNILPHDKTSSQIGPSNLGRQYSHEFLYQRCAEKLASTANSNPVQDSLTETLTKAITADPGAFKSVIAAAISSIVGGVDQSHKQDGVEVERLGQRLTLGHEAVSHTTPLTQNGNGLASSSVFNGLSSSNF